MHFLKGLVLGNLRIAIPALVIGTGMLAAGLLVGLAWAGSPGVPVDVTESYRYDAVSESWVKSVVSFAAAPETGETMDRVGEGTGAGNTRRGSRTIIIYVDRNSPVKSIIIANALVKRGDQPLLEIAGRADSSGNQGKLIIGLLKFDLVDAQRLTIEDTEAVQLDVEDTVAKDNELEIHVTAVNVVRIERGAITILRVGRTVDDIQDEDDEENGDDQGQMRRDKSGGIRVDRIRILGPEGQNGFVESIKIIDSSFDGRIEVDDVRAQQIVLSRVSLDDDQNP